VRRSPFEKGKSVVRLVSAALAGEPETPTQDADELLERLRALTPSARRAILGVIDGELGRAQPN
jgi:predicted protein tyrosine phosphatase